MKKELEIYVHIPFCARKCAYCDFLSAPAGEGTQTEYIEMLKREIRENAYLADAYEVSSVFVGGGTPSVLPGDLLEEVFRVLRTSFSFRPDAEISVECNPGTLTSEKLECYKMAGVNRLSIGLQSAHNDELRILGRIHTWEEFEESFRLAREAGFSNINVDLMSALPGQSTERWRDTLSRVLELEPEHISAYSLIIEEGTPFYEKYGVGPEADLLPDEDTEREMYYDTKRILEAAGYFRYEISNYAKPGRECRHNLGYWRRVEYKGFGLGAASLVNGCRYQNQTSLPKYLQGNFAYESEERLTPADALSETMFLGLRTMEGVELTDQIRHVFGNVIEKYCGMGFLEIYGERLCLTESGIDVCNGILADFLVDEEEPE